jgi:hypothetical protein
MTKQQPKLEQNHDKDEGSAAPPEAEKSPMDKFRALARGVLHVSQEQIDAEQRLYKSSRDEPIRRGPLKST